MGVHQEIPRSEILIPEDLSPKPLLPSIELPNPFGHETDVHEPGVDDAQSPQGLGFAERIPSDPVVLAPRAIGFPEKSGPVFPKDSMDALSQEVHPHSVKRKVGEASVDEGQASHGRHEFPHPWVRSPPHPSGKRTPVRSLNGAITNGEPQVGERECALLAVKQVGDRFLLLVSGPQYHDLTLVEVNAKAGHVLKTEKEELEVCKSKRIRLEHDDRIIGILQVGDSPFHKVRNQPCNVPSPRGCLEDGSQGLNRKVKEERGERVPLADAAAITEVIPDFPIDRDCHLPPETRLMARWTHPGSKPFL